MAWIAVSLVIGSGKSSQHLPIIASTVTVTTCQCKWWRLRWIRQWFETNARYNFSVLGSISQYLASVVTGLRLSVDMRPSTSPSIKAYKRCSKRAVVTAPPKASSNSTDSTLQETARSTHWETLYLCGRVCRCQSGFLVEDDGQC